MSRQIGVALKEHGAGLVIAEIDRKGNAVVVGIEALPFDIEVVAARVADLDAHEAADARFYIDAEGLGFALWSIAAPERRSKRWALYEGMGLERQELVDLLVVTMHDEALHFAPDLDAWDLMTKALLGYKRQVKEDGLVGSELVVALCLAIQPLPRPRIGAFLA